MIIKKDYFMKKNQNKVAKMSAKMNPAEYAKANPIEAAFVPLLSVSTGVLGGLNGLVSKDPDFALFMFVSMILCGVIVLSTDAFSERLKNKERAKRILSSATRMYIKDIIANETPSVDNSKPLFKDQKEVLSDEESMNALSNHMFNNLRKSEQQDAANILKKLFINNFSESSKKTTVSSLKAAVEGIVNILKNHEHVQQDSLEDLYIQMLRKNNELYIKQQQEKNMALM